MFDYQFGYIDMLKACIIRENIYLYPTYALRTGRYALTLCMPLVEIRGDTIYIIDHTHPWGNESTNALFEAKGFAPTLSYKRYTVIVTRDVWLVDTHWAHRQLQDLNKLDGWCYAPQWTAGNVRTYYHYSPMVILPSPVSWPLKMRPALWLPIGWPPPILIEHCLKIIGHDMIYSSRLRRVPKRCRAVLVGYCLSLFEMLALNPLLVPVVTKVILWCARKVTWTHKLSVKQGMSPRVLPKNPSKKYLQWGNQLWLHSREVIPNNIVICLCWGDPVMDGHSWDPIAILIGIETCEFIRAFGC